MARSQSQPAPAGASVPPAPPIDEDLLPAVQADAQYASQALSSVLQLLQGCPQAHQVTAGGLAALLEPIAAGLEVLCTDLDTACRVWSVQ